MFPNGRLARIGDQILISMIVVVNMCLAVGEIKTTANPIKAILPEIVVSGYENETRLSGPEIDPVSASYRCEILKK